MQRPTCRRQFVELFGVAFDISRTLRLPEIGGRLQQTIYRFARVPVLGKTVNEDDFEAWATHDVRLPRQILPVQLAPITHEMEERRTLISGLVSRPPWPPVWSGCVTPQARLGATDGCRLGLPLQLAIANDARHANGVGVSIRNIEADVVRLFRPISEAVVEGLQYLHVR